MAAVQVHTDKRIVPVQRDCDAEPTLNRRVEPVRPAMQMQTTSVPPVCRVVCIPDTPLFPRGHRDLRNCFAVALLVPTLASLVLDGRCINANGDQHAFSC